MADQAGRNSEAAQLVLRAITLRGIGSYLHGARLDVRPLTLICGMNGSGKSTWFKVLNWLRGSLAHLPFDDTQFRSWSSLSNACIDRGAADAVRDVDDEQADVAFGPLGTIGLHFDSTHDFAFTSGKLRAFTAAQPTSAVQRFLWLGQCAKGLSFRLRMAHPERPSPGRSLDDWVELRLNQAYVVRLHRPAAGRRYALSCSRGLLPGERPSDDTTVALAEVEITPNGRSYRVFSSKETAQPKISGALARLFIERIRQSLCALFQGYFYIGAIRQVHEYGSLEELEDEHDTRRRVEWLADQRYVGSHGEATLVLERRFAHNLMRNARPPFTGHFDQRFNEHQVKGWKIWSRIQQAAGAGVPDSEWQIWQLVPPDLKERLLAADKLQTAGLDRDGYDQRITALVVEMLNSLLPSRQLAQAHEWPDMTEEARLLLNRGVDSLADDEVERLNRLLLESLFFGSDEIRKLQLSFRFEDFASFWLDNLVNVQIRFLRKLDGFRSDWTQPHAPPHGFLVHGLPRPQPLIPRWVKQRMGQDVDGSDLDEADDLHRFGHPCFGDTDEPQGPYQFSAGFHQVAPIVVQSGVLQPGELLAVENPEVHLHPSLQLQITEFLIGEAATGKVIFVETHSDLVVRRVLRAILEETIPQEQVRLYFTDLRPSSVGGGCLSSILQRLEVNQRGQVSNWPDGFMDDDVQESRRLLDVLYGSEPPSVSQEDP